MDEEKIQKKACKLAEEEDVPVLPPFTFYGGFVKMKLEDFSDEFVPIAEAFKKGGK